MLPFVLKKQVLPMAHVQWKEGRKYKMCTLVCPCVLWETFAINVRTLAETIAKMDTYTVPTQQQYL